MVVPVAQPNGEIVEGTPVLTRVYAAGNVYVQPDKLVAMR